MLLAVAIVLSMFLNPWLDPVSHPDYYLDSYSSIVVPLVIFIGDLALGRKWLLGVLRVPNTPLPTTIVWVIAGASFLLVLGLAESIIFHKSFHYVDYLFRTNAPMLWFLSQVATGSVGPFTEEVFFRGVFQTELTKRLGSFISIPLVAIAFALIHFSGHDDSAIRIAQICLTGLVFGIARHRFDSLGPPIAIHALYNIGVTLLEVYGP